MVKCAGEAAYVTVSVSRSANRRALVATVCRTLRCDFAQSVNRDSASVTVNPEATVHVGQRKRLKPSLKALIALEYDGRLKSELRAHNRRWNLYSSALCGPLSRRCD